MPILYPSTADALAKAKDYKHNFMDLSAARKYWWHDYPYNEDFKIRATWGKDNYFFAYALWIHPVEIGDPEEIGWEDGQIKPYKAWIFEYQSSPTGDTWIVVVDCDLPAWDEDTFFTDRKTIKAMP